VVALRSVSQATFKRPVRFGDTLHIEGRIADLTPGSEDAGLVEPSGSADWVLVVDPIDGTRPAMAGFEMACVSVAAAPLDDEPRMGDVTAGCVVEIKSGNRFVAGRGEGVQADVA